MISNKPRHNGNTKYFMLSIQINKSGQYVCNKQSEIFAHYIIYLPSLRWNLKLQSRDIKINKRKKNTSHFYHLRDYYEKHKALSSEPVNSGCYLFPAFHHHQKKGETNSCIVVTNNCKFYNILCGKGSLVEFVQRNLSGNIMGK